MMAKKEGKRGRHIEVRDSKLEVIWSETNVPAVVYEITVPAFSFFFFLCDV